MSFIMVLLDACFLRSEKPSDLPVLPKEADPNASWGGVDGDIGGDRTRADVARFLNDNAALLKLSTVDQANSIYQTALDIVHSIPLWAWPPIIVIAIVIVVVAFVPFLVISVTVLKDPVALGQIVALGAFAACVAVMFLFI